MKTKPQHTPTPWKVTEIPSVDLWGKRSQQAMVSDSDGKGIAVVGQNCEADARFIVRAVNSHEAFMELAALVRAGEGKTTVALDKALEAIAKAEGK